MRILYLAIHDHELSDKQRATLDGYHNLNELTPYDPERDYSDFYAFIITRNPYARVVSAFVDQYAYAQNEGVNRMFALHPPRGGVPQTFVEFLEYLKNVPDAERDSHFQTQSFFSHTDTEVVFRKSLIGYLKRKKKKTLTLDLHADIAKFNPSMRKVYRKIFRNNKEMMFLAEEKIAGIQRHNSSFYDEVDYDDAALLSIAALDEIRFAPKPQDFFTSERARSLVQEIYAQDFRMFNYDVEDIPHKQASEEISAIPDDLDWQMYLRLNPDLPPDEIYNERTVIRHYLEFGRFEEVPRAYKIEAPQGFDWRRYLSLHDDLPAAGITTESAAIEHYISYGIREEREI